ncbi:MAG TPA: hypothetical protein VM261_10855 [Kofleriaceae bacterium]|nr:hypothetical protein [Kofleriaceae bacterium]
MPASTRRDEILNASSAELARALAAGRAFDPATALAGWTYHGTSLGLPAWIERLTWKTFAKAFVRDPDNHGAEVRGWNVRCQQATPPTWQPRRSRDGVPVAFGHFAVVTDATSGSVLLDYGRGGNRRHDPVGAVRDPLVALDDDATILLGRSLVAIASRVLSTPSFFLLERGSRVEHVAHPPRARYAAA